MIREFAGKEMVQPEKDFRWRGSEITRLRVRLSLPDASMIAAIF